MNNVHTRHFRAPIEQVRVWIAACWSGGDRDCFPHDVIASWRRNPDGGDPTALIPGTTMLGHGSFRFRLREWDDRSWKVDVVGGMTGWHGFDLVPDGDGDGDGCHVTHTVSLELSVSSRLRWMVIAPLHDWAVEAMFDRMEHALRTGIAPPRTERPMSVVVATAMWLLRRSRRARAPGRATPAAG